MRLRREHPDRPGMLEEYGESMRLGGQIDAAGRYSGKAGYIRHAQSSIWWERLLGIAGLLALVYALGHWLVVHLS